MARIISVSADQSQIATDVSVLAANGVAVCTVYVTVQQDREDANGNAMPIQTYDASKVVVSVTPSTGVTITQPTGTSDANGTVTATFISTNAATVSIGATAFGRTVTGNATVVVGGSVTPPAPGDPFFSDSFAGGVKTNANGFTWNSTTSDVTVQLAPDASGDYALRFRFGPDASGEDSSAEQRFNMGRDLTEVWLDYYVWVPSNYVHRNDTGPDNNKFFRLWGDNYNAVNKVGASTNPDTTNPPSRLYFEGRVAPDGTSMGSISGTPTAVYGDAPMLGAWTRIRMQFGMVTAAENDGVFRVWKGDTLVVERTDLPLNYDASIPYWNNGYFFGWSNSGFLEQTDFYIRGGTNGPKFYDADPGWL